MDPAQLQLVVIFLATAVLIPIVFYISRKARLDRMRIRTELSHQREDSLRSINLMVQQMDYDAEVLRLLRHARNMRDEGRKEEFSGAIDTLEKKENEMMDRVDRVRDFEVHLRQRYGKKSILPRLGKGGLEDATPEQIKADIHTFVATLERIRAGEPRLLEEKIAFFEKWVEGSQRRRIYTSLKAMALFLEKGDSSELEKLKEKGARGQGDKGTKQEWDKGKGGQGDKGAGGKRGGEESG
jgi:hypothetical protein